MERKECRLIELGLNLIIGKINIQTIMTCFDGWNRRGLISYIGRMMGMKKCTFDIYVDSECSPYRSIFYYNEFNSIKAVYREDEEVDLLSRFTLVESPKRMKL
jgi:hypothetical protein